MGYKQTSNKENGKDIVKLTLTTSRKKFFSLLLRQLDDCIPRAKEAFVRQHAAAYRAENGEEDNEEEEASSDEEEEQEEEEARTDEEDDNDNDNSDEEDDNDDDDDDDYDSEFIFSNE